MPELSCGDARIAMVTVDLSENLEFGEIVFQHLMTCPHCQEIYDPKIKPLLSPEVFAHHKEHRNA